ncbi:MAG: undecaprenyl/decaprenyl-phosphate alpha-N-acetylglucosaminyl 1-phosphate transferase [Bacteroidales bacterium]|nr:undecaprenyl/decaprenyl-phosphate alpha-N-acetylglucosaminyl 1-phosphate transferase [Bacteroidales bacterium]
MEFISELSYKYRLIALFLISFISTMIVFKPILRIAIKKDIVDNPDARKLQKKPVPVMGGIAVFFGIMVGLCFYKTMISYTALFPVVSAMTIMMYLGCMDDILSVRADTRFGLEILVAATLIFGLKCHICNFQGLWGIDIIPSAIGAALSVLTFLGLVNAINMIDGVDGLSSAFCVLIFGCFGIFCFLSRDYSFAVLSAVCIGALLPFFLHNVFGYTTKMFIGDGGTMMMGTAISAMVFVILRENNAIEVLQPELDFSRIAFVIAVLSMPVADTLRVMFCRMAHKKSPFEADKTHLHHLFVAAGFSYISITMIEIAMDIFVIAAFLLTWWLGGSLEMQLYITVGVAALLNWGLAAVLVVSAKKDDKLYHGVKYIGSHSHVERRGLWLKVQHLIDNKFEK